MGNLTKLDQKTQQAAAEKKEPKVSIRKETAKEQVQGDEMYKELLEFRGVTKKLRLQLKEVTVKKREIYEKLKTKFKKK